jgi:hypothetical protein
MTATTSIPMLLSQWFATDLCPEDMLVGDTIVSVNEGMVVSTSNKLKNDDIRLFQKATVYGNYVVVKHTELFYTLYAHLTDVDVKVGDKVKRGQRIGTLGDTGSSTAPHLHFQACILNPSVAAKLGIIGQLLPFVSGQTSRPIELTGYFIKEFPRKKFNDCKTLDDMMSKLITMSDDVRWKSGKGVDISDTSVISLVKPDNNLSVIESYVTEARTSTVPIYVVSMNYDSVFSKVVRAYTKSEYNHSAIALDNSLSEMYTFIRETTTTDNSTPNGFSIETIESMLTKDMNATIKVVKFDVPEDKYNAFYERVSHYKRSNRTSYDFENIYRVPLGIEKKTDDGKFVCSTFVADAVKSMGIKLPKAVNLMTPSDISNLKGGEVYYIGKLEKYSVTPDMESVALESVRDDVVRAGGFYSNGKWNSVKEINGKLYRHRVECLVFKDDEIYLQKKGDTYRIPGGSTEKNVSDDQQVKNECLEEARIVVDNVQY